MKSGGQVSAFFRQSGWMVVATTGGGVFMMAVHLFAPYMPRAEYGVFQTLLQVLNLILIPSVGLQSVFAQQTAAAITPERQRQLAGTIRAVLAGTFGIWLVILGIVFVLHRDLLAMLQMRYPAGLWVTVVGALAMLWLPILQGVLQGSQNFLWLGWTAIINGVGRFILICLIVVVFQGYAAGAMSGAMLAMWVAAATGGWQTRQTWLGVRVPFDWRSWLARVIPLTLGLGSAIFMLAADQIVVQSLFDREKTPFYAAAGMFARGLVMFTTPLAAVMFPKIVASAARSERTDVMVWAFGATALLGGGAALACTLFPRLPIQIVYRDPVYVEFAPPLLPWFAWAMLPLTLTNVLLSNLLAREIFRVVPWLLVVVAGYVAALLRFHDSFLTVIRTLGVFNLLMLALVVGFTWAGRRRT